MERVKIRSGARNCPAGEHNGLDVGGQLNFYILCISITHKLDKYSKTVADKAIAPKYLRLELNFSILVS